jgi:predicted transcriptional regulator
LNGREASDRTPFTISEEQMTEEQNINRSEILALTTEIVAAHIANNAVVPDDVPQLIQSVFDKLSALAGAEDTTAVELTPAVPIRRSVSDDYIICLEDGKKLKMLKRHLMTAYGMTPEEYRAKWGLKPDYPMVAPNYSRTRQELAKKIGLGRKPAVAAPAPEPKSRRSRAKAAAA